MPAFPRLLQLSTLLNHTEFRWHEIFLYLVTPLSQQWAKRMLTAKCLSTQIPKPAPRPGDCCSDPWQAATRYVKYIKVVCYVKLHVYESCALFLLTRIASHALTCISMSSAQAWVSDMQPRKRYTEKNNVLALDGKQLQVCKLYICRSIPANDWIATVLVQGTTYPDALFVQLQQTDLPPGVKKRR